MELRLLAGWALVKSLRMSSTITHQPSAISHQPSAISTHQPAISQPPAPRFQVPIGHSMAAMDAHGRSIKNLRNSKPEAHCDR
jgi:hypothetical protein